MKTQNKTIIGITLVAVLLIIAIIVSTIPSLVSRSEITIDGGSSQLGNTPQIGPVICNTSLTKGNEKYNYNYNLNRENSDTTTMNSSIVRLGDNSYTRTTAIITSQKSDQIEAVGLGSAISFEIELDERFECKNAVIIMTTVTERIVQDLPCQSELYLIDVCEDDKSIIGNETITVTAGTFDTNIYADSENKTQVWMSEELPIPIRMLTGGVEIELVSYERSIE